jgi:hypothetical protein
MFLYRKGNSLNPTRSPRTNTPHEQDVNNEREQARCKGVAGFARTRGVGMSGRVLLDPCSWRAWPQCHPGAPTYILALSHPRSTAFMLWRRCLHGIQVAAPVKASHHQRRRRAMGRRARRPSKARDGSGTRMMIPSLCMRLRSQL